MAKLVEQDGKVSGMGGIAAIRKAFVDAGAGRLTCTTATLEYDHGAGPNAQVLRFAGRLAADASKTFDVTSAPIAPGGSLADAAAALAAKVLAET